MEGLKIKIGADYSDVEKGLSALQARLRSFSSTIGASVRTDPFDKLKASVASLKANMASFKPLQIPPIQDPFPKVVKGANQATQSLINLSRVAQDAPFGFMGIANNLNPLLESFQRLRAETGSNATAFKALGAGLMGPAGIGLALGVASSLLITFGDKLAGLIGTANKAKESLKGIFADASKNSAEEIVKLEVFRKKLNDVNIPAAERTKIAKEYNAIADQTNQLDLKQIGNLEQINQKINAQNSLIKQRALSTAALSKLTDASSKLIDNELKLQMTLQASGITYKEVEKAAQESFSKQVAGTQAVRKGLDNLSGQKPIFIDGKPVEQVSKVNNALISLFNEVKSGRYEFDQLSNSLKGFITIDGLTIKSGQATKALKELKEFVVMIGREVERTTQIAIAPKINTVLPAAPLKGIGLTVPLNFTIDTPGTIKSLQEAVQLTRTQFENKWIEEFSKRGLSLSKIKFSLDDNSAEEANKQIVEYADSIQSVLEATFSNMAVAIGEGLGDALSGNGLQGMFQNLFNIIGNGLQALGKQMIVASKLIQTLKTSLGTPTGLVAGIGLVAVGQLIKNLTTNVKAFAQGGIVYGPTLGMVGEYAGASSNPEVIAPLSKLKDIIGGSGGGNFPDYLPAHRIDGNDLLLWYTRASSSNNSNF